MFDVKGIITGAVQAVNSVDENVWGVLMIALGASLYIFASTSHAPHADFAREGAAAIVGAGAMAFRGNRQ